MAMTWAPELEDMEEEEVWAGYYSSAHEILLVGEGDFSFSLSLAKSFGSASNIVATSLDSYDAVVSKYSNAKSNLSELCDLGATLLHGVDATRMRLDPNLRSRRFDRIVFNFPHAGFKGREDNPSLINLHRKLVQGFLRNARGMLRQGGEGGGEVHVSHKMGATFYRWDLPGLARGCGLALVGMEPFRTEDYPGYRNKRGDGARADQPFPLKECCTYMFVPGRPEKKKRCAADWSVGVDDGIGGENGFVGTGPPSSWVASFGDYVPSPDDIGGCSWSIHSPARPAPAAPVTQPAPWLALPSPPKAAHPAAAASLWSSSAAAAGGYFQRAYEDAIIARCQRLLDRVQMLDRAADAWSVAPRSSSCLVGLQQPARGAEAADSYRDPYWVY